MLLKDGYDRNKTPRMLEFRRFTLDDIKRLNDIHHELWFEDRHGMARRCRRNGKLKTWKRDPNRFECSFKYGMYESWRMNTQQMLDTLLIPVTEH